MRFAFLLFGALAAAVFSGQEDQANDFTLPAEFETQEAVWMSARPTENGKPVLDVVIEMVRVLAPHVRIQLMVPNEAVKLDVQKRLRREKISERQITYWTTHAIPRAGIATWAQFSLRTIVET